MTAPTRAETIAHGAAGHRRGEGCCALSDKAKSGVAPDAVKPESMSWIPGGGFLMGSNSFYREERPVRSAFVEGFWMDVYPVTNAAFRKFVDATGYVTYSERPPNPAMYPDADPALLVPGSLVFVKPDRPVSLRNNLAWWEYKPGADWRHPEGPASSIAGRDMLRGPGYVNLDLTLAKSVALAFLGESGKLEFRAEAFNVLNHVNFATPSRTVFAGRANVEAPLANAGLITATANASRQIQFGLKILF